MPPNWQHAKLLEHAKRGGYEQDRWDRVGNFRRLGLHAAFPADMVNFLRAQAYKAFLVRMPPIALRASP